MLILKNLMKRGLRFIFSKFRIQATSSLEKTKKFVLLFCSSILLSKITALSFFIAAIGGYFFAKHFSGKSVGEQGKWRSIVINLGSYRVHIHHWLLSFISMVSLYLKDFHLYFFEIFLPVCGFCLAVIFHGIYHYTDWFKVIYKIKEKGDAFAERFSPPSKSINIQIKDPLMEAKNEKA